MQSTGCVLDLHGGAGTAWRDHSVHKNHGTLDAAGMRTTLANGLEVIEFDGSDRVTVSNTSILNISNIAFCTWVVPAQTYDSGLAAEDYIFFKRNVANQDLMYVYFNTDGKIWIKSEQANDGNEYVSTTTTSWPSGTAFFLFVGWDTSYGLRLVINGTQESADAGENVVMGPGTASALYLGNDTAGSDGMVGQLYRPRIYTYAMSAAQIARIYQRERGLFGV